jgi:RNA polymerase sigma factor (sigma-70 family)
MHDPREDSSGDASRLDAIPTRPSLLQAAHQGGSAQAGPARNALVMRYRKAMRSYLGRFLQNEADADEVAQDVLVKMLKGQFAGVTASRGRFRDYLKVSVRNAALNHIRRQDKGATIDPEILGSDSAGRAAEEDWLANWRRILLESARQSLAAYQKQRPGNVYATLLDLLAEFPDDDSEELARRLEKVLGQRYRADAVRKQISRARRKFAELLVDEVRRTLDEPSPDQVETELTELGLLSYIQDFLPGETAE